MRVAKMPYLQVVKGKISGADGGSTRASADHWQGESDEMGWHRQRARGKPAVAAVDRQVSGDDRQGRGAYHLARRTAPFDMLNYPEVIEQGPAVLTKFDKSANGWIYDIADNRTGMRKPPKVLATAIRRR
jgi:hypothetical protein